jgi:hypothetical protein
MLNTPELNADMYCKDIIDDWLRFSSHYRIYQMPQITNLFRAVLIELLYFAGYNQ